MRKNQLLSVLSLFLLVPASITRAQTATLTGTVSIEQDYRVVNFNSPNGNVKVFLPGDLSGPGQGTVLLSGTVMTEPAGKTEKEKTANLKALQKMLLSIGGKSISILPAQNHFDFSMPANLTTPVPIDMLDPGGNRATVMLKNPVISPPPMTGTLAPGQPSLLTDQKVYLTNGNIPVYAANNTSTLFQPTDKFFIKAADGNIQQATKIAQSPTQTVLSSQGMQPGTTTIIRQSGNRTDQVNIRMANLTLSSPNTNLLKGETSSLTVTIDPKITDRDSAEAMQIPIMSLDVRNISPNVVSMAGGNEQVMTFPTTPGSTSPAAWQATRTITGVTPGNFNISATLYPSSSISNNMANTRMQGLKTADEFNKWINAIKQQLGNLFSSSNDQATKDLIRNTINALPLCSSEDELDLYKMMADNLLRASAIPGLNLATTTPGFAAFNLLASELPWDPKRKLGGDDFKGTPPKGSELSAEAAVYFKVYYDSTKKAWVVIAVFDTNESWMNPDGKKDAALINHEQRHFDLAELFARKLRKKIKDLPKKDQTQENIDKLAKETADEMKEEQEKYDKETDHGTDAEKQKEWDKNIDKGMEDYKDYAS